MSPRRDPADRTVALTTRGRCLLAGGLATAACAVVLDERDLLRVGVFVALLPILALGVAALVRRAATAERTLDPARLPVGAMARVTLRLRGERPVLGALVGAVRVVDGVPDALGPHEADPPRFDVSGLGGRAAVIRSYPLTPVLRGAHRVGPLRAAATDPLGLASFARDLVGQQGLLVVPRVEPLTGLPPTVSRGEGTPGAALSHQGQGRSDVLVRAYRPGDELRRVHWRSSARHDELMVRLEERPWRSGTTVLLDRRAGAHAGRGPAASFERAVSAVASICAHLRAAGEPFTLLAEDGTALTAPEQDHEALLDLLAVLRPSARPRLAGPPLPRGTAVLAVLGALTDGDAAAIVARHPGGAAGALLLDTTAAPPPGGRRASPTGRSPLPGDAELRRAGWSTAVLGADTPLAAGWARLVVGTT